MLAREKGFAAKHSKPLLRRAQLMSNEHDFLRVGEAYQSKRTGRSLTILAIEGERIYYSVEGFKTIAPLFLPKDKFLHLIGRSAADKGDA